MSRTQPSVVWSRGPLVVAMFGLVACGAPSEQGPDLVLTGGRIYVDGSPESVVSALAIQGDTIVAAGTDDEIRALAVENTQEMALDGAAVLPGFHDAWVDVEAVGRWSQGLDLSRSATPRELQARVREVAAGSGWIVGWGWDETLWPRPELPPIDLLDGIVGERPVLLYRRSGGLAWANRSALAAAGVDPAGLAGTGVIFGRALRQLEAQLPPPEPGQRREWIAAGLSASAAAGFTRVSTAPIGSAAIADYRDLESQGDLIVRVDLRLDTSELSAPLPTLSSLQLRIVAAGLRIDGPFSPPLAALLAPYSDPSPWAEADSFNGILLADVTEIGQACDSATRSGLRLDVLAAGDLAVSAALDGCPSLRNGNGLIVGADLLPSPAADLGSGRFVVVPSRMAHDLYWLEQRLGPERARRTHPYRDLAAAGTLAGVASLAPEFPLSPLGAALVMWTRRDRDGFPLDGWNGPQRISVRDGLSALLDGGERASLQPGHPADLVVWSEDPHDGKETSLEQARALLTVVAGRVTYSRPLRELPFDRQ